MQNETWAFGDKFKEFAVGRVLGCLDRFLDLYERRLDFEMKRDIRIAADNEKKFSLQKQKMEA